MQRGFQRVEIELEGIRRVERQERIVKTMELEMEMIMMDWIIEILPRNTILRGGSSMKTFMNSRSVRQWTEL